MSAKSVSQKLLSVGLPIDVLRDVAAWPRTEHARHMRFRFDDSMPRMLESGWVLAGANLPDGRREELHLFLPGDLIDTSLLRSTPVGFNPASTAVVVEIPERVLSRTEFKRFAEVDRAARAATMRGHALRLDRFDSLGRIAHFLLETEDRLRRSGRETGPVLTWQLRQPQIGDYLSLSSSHVCRTLMKLKLAGLADLTRGFRLYDKDRLRAVCKLQLQSEFPLAV